MKRLIAVLLIGLGVGLMVQPVAAATFNYRAYVLKTFLAPAETTLDEVYTQVSQPVYDMERVKSNMSKAQGVMHNSGDFSEDARFAQMFREIDEQEVALQNAHNVLQSTNNTQKAQMAAIKRACGTACP